jgi:hydrogenase expression/formation protein HypD
LKYLSEYRGPVLARSLVERILTTATRPRVIMEVCGGQTHTIVRQGLQELLKDAVDMIHGPGCPVCVTPLEQIDRALYLAARPEVIFTSFGDMLRVPGSECDLSMAVWRARELGISNFSVLVSHVTVPPAIRAILDAPDNRVEAFLAAGHVCTVMGWEEYEPLAAEYGTPIVVTGFEPVDILEGIHMAVRQLEEGRAEVENQYVRSVRRSGNEPAQELVSKVFELVDRSWRGIGEIPASGLGLREEFQALDAEKKFDLGSIRTSEPAECMAGDVLRGRIKPFECPAFGMGCTPERPLGAPMVSSEGACAAYYNYARFQPERAGEPA